jgi:hypothetical protein
VNYIARKNKEWGSESAIGSCFVNGKAREIMEEVTGEKRKEAQRWNCEEEGWMYKAGEEPRRHQVASPLYRSLIY